MPSNNTNVNSNVNVNSESNVNNNNILNRENIEDVDYQVEWDTNLDQYRELYINYLTKKVKEGKNDNELRNQVINKNQMLIALINELKDVNDKMVNSINQQHIESELSDEVCKVREKTIKDSTDTVIQDNITINKKLKNITEKLMDAKKLLIILYIVSAVILLFNLASIYFIIKQ